MKLRPIRERFSLRGRAPFLSSYYDAQLLPAASRLGKAGGPEQELQVDNSQNWECPRPKPKRPTTLSARSAVTTASLILVLLPHAAVLFGAIAPAGNEVLKPPPPRLTPAGGSLGGPAQAPHALARLAPLG